MGYIESLEYAIEYLKQHAPGTEEAEIDVKVMHYSAVGLLTRLLETYKTKQESNRQRYQEKPRGEDGLTEAQRNLFGR